MAKIVVTTLGTLGDLHPMFPVAAGLQQRGHSVRFVVPPQLQPRVVNEGFDTEAVNMMPDPPAATVNEDRSAKANINRYYTPFLKSAINVLSKACAGADVLLSTPHQIATAVVGQRLHIPWVTLTVFPGFIPSAYTVPEPHWLPALPTPAGRVVNRFTWSVFRYGLRYLSEDAIGVAVRSYGMVSDRDLFSPGAFSPYLCILMSSPVYSPRLPDWPPQVKVTGFVPWDRPRGWTEPPELEAFLAEGEPPILVTTSTATERNAAAFIWMARQALEKLGRRGILLTGRATQEVLGDQSHVITATGIGVWPYLPLSRVLPHASMVVHHSGIGTATATIRCGLPALAIPASFDQWYNGGRVRALGVGRVIKYDGLTMDRLAGAINSVATQPRYRTRAQELGKLMEGEDGAGRACDEIEALLRARVPS
jgi:rhamnosyltransferase subunit B